MAAGGAPAGRVRAVMISLAAGLAPLDEYAAQLAAIGADLVRAQREALLGVDEAVLLHLRVPAGLQRLVHGERGSRSA